MTELISSIKTLIGMVNCDLWSAWLRLIVFLQIAFLYFDQVTYGLLQTINFWCLEFTFKYQNKTNDCVQFYSFLLLRVSFVTADLSIWHDVIRKVSYFSVSRLLIHMASERLLSVKFKHFDNVPKFHLMFTKNSINCVLIIVALTNKPLYVTSHTIRIK